METSATLKAFSIFLKSERKKDFIEEVINQSHQNKLPAMEQLKGLSELKVYQLFEQGLMLFLDDIVKDRPLEGVIDSLSDWMEKKLGTEIKSLSYTDVISGYQVRKQVMIRFIDAFTNDPLKYIDLVQELTVLMTTIEKATVDFLSKNYTPFARTY
ncbi:MAG TPA: hypothetical protein VF691_23100 [Cytophagaceae bacterium]|jgi:hypothetical protein